MNKLLKILPQLMMVLLISGCSFYVETAKVRGMYDDAQDDVSEKIEEIKEDRDQRNNMIQSITSQIPNSKITPYPELNDKLAEMDKSIDDLEKAQVRMLSLRKRFDKLTEGKKRFESDQPEWSRHKRVEDGYKKIMNGMRSIMNNYSRSAESFNDIAEKYLRKVDVEDVRSDINEFLSDFDNEIKDFQSELDKRRSNSSDSDNTSRESTFQEIDQIIEKIKNKREILESILNTFNLEVGDEKEFMTGPGLKTYTITNDLVAISDEFSSYINQLEKLAKKL